MLVALGTDVAFASLEGRNDSSIALQGSWAEVEY